MRVRSAVVAGTLTFALCPVLLERLAAAPVQEPDTHPMALVVRVNGAEKPNLIPDNLAFAHFILSAAQPAQPSEADTARRSAIQARLGLSARDEPRLHSALGGVHAQLKFIERETQRLFQEPDQTEEHLSRIENFRLQRTRVLDEAQSRLLAALTAEGRGKLKEYIDKHVKPRIVIYGDAEQGTSGEAR
jgi:hypothetical protein